MNNRANIVNKELISKIERYPILETKTGLYLDHFTILTNDNYIEILFDILIEDESKIKKIRGVKFVATLFDGDYIMKKEISEIYFDNFVGIDTINIRCWSITPENISKIRLIPIIMNYYNKGSHKNKNPKKDGNEDFQSKLF